MRYFAVFILVIGVAGTALGQENSLGEEETTHAVVEPEDPIGPDGRDMDNILGIIGEIKEVIQTDYEILLTSDSEASGTITVSFSITPEGTVSDASVDCPEALISLQEDVLTKLESLELGASPDQIEDIPVTVPFSLSPPH